MMRRVTGKCEIVVTGDRGLLELQSYEKIRIGSPRDFWRTEARAGKRR